MFGYRWGVIGGRLGVSGLSKDKLEELNLHSVIDY